MPHPEQLGGLLDADAFPERPQRKHRGGVQPVAHAGGVDVFDDREFGGTGQEDDEAGA
jgi:hypothetical protein